MQRNASPEDRKAYYAARYRRLRASILAQQKEYRARPENRERKAAYDQARYQRIAADPTTRQARVEQAKAAPSYRAKHQPRQPARYRRTWAEWLAELAARPKAPKKRSPDRRVRARHTPVVERPVPVERPAPVRSGPVWTPQPVSRWEPGLDKGYGSLADRARTASIRELVA